MENMPSFNQLQINAPIQRSENNVAFKNEPPQRIFDADMSWMKQARELGSFGHYQDQNKGMHGSENYHILDFAYQHTNAAMLYDGKSENGTYLREDKGKRMPVVGRFKAYKTQGAVKSFSNLSLADSTGCDDTELDPSINARAIGLGPPPMTDWDRVVAKMQQCLRYLTLLRNQREFGIEKSFYTLQISSRFPKLSSYWHSFDKVIQTEYKLVIISLNICIVLLLSVLSHFSVVFVRA